MAFRNIYISKPTQLSIEDECLRVEQAEVSVRIPTEDILSIMIDDPSVILNSYVISHLAQRDVLVYTCDRTHLPCAMLSPFASHTTQTKRIRQQIALSEPFRKQLWRKVVKAKIENQARCLFFLNMQNNDLKRIANEVKSGDKNGREGVAAVLYFNRLFGEHFTRNQDILTNACLNYGYAILRGLIARSLVAHGFIPDLGIHHCNELNNYNLADDFIEPLRPCVDIVVATNTIMRGVEGLVHISEISWEKVTDAGAFVRSIERKDVACQKFPVLEKLSVHETT